MLGLQVWMATSSRCCSPALFLGWGCRHEPYAWLSKCIDNSGSQVSIWEGFINVKRKRMGGIAVWNKYGSIGISPCLLLFIYGLQIGMSMSVLSFLKGLTGVRLGTASAPSTSSWFFYQKEPRILAETIISRARKWKYKVSPEKSSLKKVFKMIGYVKRYRNHF